MERRGSKPEDNAKNRFPNQVSSPDEDAPVVHSSHFVKDQSRRLASVKLSRGQALQLFGGAIAGATLGGLIPLFSRSGAAYAQTTSNPIVIENQQPGSSAWRIPQTGYAVASYATGQIKGYASATSVNKGEQITFYVSVNPVQTYTIDIYRMGWYGGLGGRLLQRIGPLDGIKQAFPTADPTYGLIDCNWSLSNTLTVPTTWTDGIYLAVLTNAQKYQNYIIFVVRDDARTAELLYQQPVTTYQAYNNYPDDGRTGKSLYDYNSYGANTSATGVPRAAKVSFNRPYDNAGAGLFYRSWDWERYFVSWIERMGYDVTYSTNHETHANAARLKTFKGFLSVGHDEYWSKQMRDNVEAARDSGVHLAFFGANGCYWQVRLEPSGANVSNRTMVCYKEANFDPVQGPTTTVLWRDPLPNRPEQSMIGVQFTSQTRNNGSVPYAVTNSSHWVYNGTSFRDGDQVAGLVGYEADRNFSEYQQPQNTSYTLLSRSPYTNYDNRSDYANSSIFKASTSGAWVFAAGTLNWSNALDAASGGADSRIQQTTKNILDTFVAAATTPDTSAPTVTSVSPSDAAANVTLTANATATFSEAMDPNTITPSTFTLVNTTTGVGVTGGVSYDATTMTAKFDPNADLEAGTRYTATVTTGAKDNAGNPLAADKVWFFTTALPSAPKAPAAPSNLTATVSGSTKKPNIKLQWRDNSDNENNFMVERSIDATSQTPTWTVLTSSLAANTTSYTDNNLARGTTYYYRVTATNSVGPSGPSNTASATTRR